MSNAQILLVNPAPPDGKKGNNVTTERWKQILDELGHSPQTAGEYAGGDYDALVALHAHKSADSIRRFSEDHPDTPLILALTGTDLYRDLEESSRAQESLERADRLVLLQPKGRDVLDEKHRAKTRVIHQSVPNVPETQKRPESTEDQFLALVVAHLRPIKDVLRVPYALRNLPEESRVHGYQLGGVLNEEYAETVREEASNNSRFTLLGEQSRERTLKYLKGADCLIIPSRLEGGANVVSEAIACETPILASDISGNRGLLGHFPGYFPLGDEHRLGKLLRKAETDSDFYDQLNDHVQHLAPKVTPANERAAWADLLEELDLGTNQGVL